MGIGGLLLGELIREGAAAAAEDNSGCYMLVTKGFDSALPISGVTCDKCLSFGESWVPGMTQLQSCKYGDKTEPVLHFWSTDKKDAAQYVGKNSGDCGNQVSANKNVNGFSNSKVYYDSNFKKNVNPCVGANHNNVVCVSAAGSQCQIRQPIPNEIVQIIQNNNPKVPLAQTADLSQLDSDSQVAVMYQYTKFDTKDALNRMAECIGKCAKKTGTSILWFIGILIGLFALYKFIEFEFDEHEGAVHARAKKD